MSGYAFAARRRICLAETATQATWSVRNAGYGSTDEVIPALTVDGVVLPAEKIRVAKNHFIAVGANEQMPSHSPVAKSDPEEQAR
jgi:hypothetical protein